MKISEGLTFDDVLLVPKFSTIQSRNDVDTSVSLGKGINLKIPIVSANMKHVTGPQMARVISTLGGMALLHRFDSLEQQVENYRLATSPTSEWDPTSFYDNIGVSIGVKDHDISRQLIEQTKTKIVCIDVAHGHTESCIETARFISKEFPEVLLIAGNIVTAAAARHFAQVGVDVLKVGIGPGSLCSTRIETGNGVPQLTALDNVYEVMKFHPRVKIIADGGIKTPGDIVKALCFSHAVMIGNLLAATDETPGDFVKLNDGHLYKQYAGSSTFKTNHIEGVSKWVRYAGSTRTIVDKLLEGLRSGMSYQGADNLVRLRSNPEFVRITNSGLIESKPQAF